MTVVTTRSNTSRYVCRVLVYMQLRMRQQRQLGFVMGNLWVRKSQPTPVPTHTTPVMGMGTHCTQKVAGSYETCGTIGTRGLYSHSAFPKASWSWCTCQLMWPVHFTKCWEVGGRQGALVIHAYLIFPCHHRIHHSCLYSLTHLTYLTHSLTSLAALLACHLIHSPLSTSTGCLTRHLPAASPCPAHLCTGSFVHVCLCCSGACVGCAMWNGSGVWCWVVVGVGERPGSDGEPTCSPMQGLVGQGFDQSPKTKHLMLGFRCAM